MLKFSYIWILKNQIAFIIFKLKRHKLNTYGLTFAFFKFKLFFLDKKSIRNRCVFNNINLILNLLFFFLFRLDFDYFFFLFFINNLNIKFSEIIIRVCKNISNMNFYFFKFINLSLTIPTFNRFSLINIRF